MPDPPAGIVTAAERLGRPELSSLVDELARRYGAGDPAASVSLRNLTGAARQALADLLASDRVPGAAARLPVARLAAALGLASPEDLRAVVQLLRGPLPDRRSGRAAELAARDELWEWFAREVAGLRLGTGPGSFGTWVASQRGAGARGGVAAHRARLESALAVLARLPADGVPLAVLASDAAGDPHALDHGRALAALVLDGASSALGLERPADAEAARALWEHLGVAPDPYSSTVLALGLRPRCAGPLAAWLGAAADAGEPAVLTLSHLRRWPLPPLQPGEALFVVENPSLLAHVAGLPGGWAGPALVCSSGRPTVAVVTLLRQLVADGATLHQHADLDPSGLSITAWLAERAGTVPWRMGEADYRSALSRLGSGAGALAGTVPPTPWDVGLGEAMRAERRVVYEEQLRSQLVEAMQAR